VVTTSVCPWLWSEVMLLVYYWSVCKFDLILAFHRVLSSVAARHLALSKE